MSLDEYFDRYGLDIDALSKALMYRAHMLSDDRKKEMVRALEPENKSAAKINLLNLVDEAQENLALAKKLRESVVGQGGQLLGTVGDVTKTLMAVDKALDGAAKRFTSIYSIHSMQALEDAVKDTLNEMDQDTYERFMNLLEDKMQAIR